MKKQISMACVALGIVGFFGATQLKTKASVYKERLTQADATVSVPVEAGSNYTFFFWGVDEEMGLQAWANLDLTGIVTDAQGTTLFTRQVTASASSSEEEGGVKRAQNGFEYHHKAETSETLTATIKAPQADYVDLEIYKDLPEWLNLAPGLSIILAIVGLVLFLKARNVTPSP